MSLDDLFEEEARRLREEAEQEEAADVARRAERSKGREHLDYETEAPEEEEAED